jgi:hypothetical protein
VVTWREIERTYQAVVRDLLVVRRGHTVLYVNSQPASMCRVLCCVSNSDIDGSDVRSPAGDTLEKFASEYPECAFSRSDSSLQVVRVNLAAAASAPGMEDGREQPGTQRLVGVKWPAQLGKLPGEQQGIDKLAIQERLEAAARGREQSVHPVEQAAPLRAGALKKASAAPKTIHSFFGRAAAGPAPAEPPPAAAASAGTAAPQAAATAAAAESAAAAKRSRASSGSKQQRQHPSSVSKKKRLKVTTGTPKAAGMKTMHAFFGRAAAAGGSAATSAAQSAAKAWVCAVCTLENPASRRRSCEVCGSPPPEGEALRSRTNSQGPIDLSQ